MGAAIHQKPIRLHVTRQFIINFQSMLDLANDILPSNFRLESRI